MSAALGYIVDLEFKYSKYGSKIRKFCENIYNMSLKYDTHREDDDYYYLKIGKNWNYQIGDMVFRVDLVGSSTLNIRCDPIRIPGVQFDVDFYDGGWFIGYSLLFLSDCPIDVEDDDGEVLMEPDENWKYSDLTGLFDIIMPKNLAVRMYNMLNEKTDKEPLLNFNTTTLEFGNYYITLDCDSMRIKFNLKDNLMNFLKKKM